MRYLVTEIALLCISAAYAQDSLRLSLPIYEITDQAMKIIVDDACLRNDRNVTFFFIDMFRTKASAYTEILLTGMDRRFMYHFVDQNYNGVVEHDGFLFFVNGVQERDLLRNSCDTLHLCIYDDGRKYDWDEFPDDEGRELYVFDKMQMYKIVVDINNAQRLKRMPVGSRYARTVETYRVVDINGRLIFETAYFNDGNIAIPLCHYHDAEGRILDVIKHDNILFRKGCRALKKYRGTNGIISVAAYVYYDTGSGEYEIRNIDEYVDDEIRGRFTKLLEKHIGHILRKQNIDGKGLILIYSQKTQKL